MVDMAVGAGVMLATLVTVRRLREPRPFVPERHVCICGHLRTFHDGMRDCQRTNWLMSPCGCNWFESREVEI